MALAQRLNGPPWHNALVPTSCRPQADTTHRRMLTQNTGVSYLGLQALLEINLRLAATDYLSNGYNGLKLV